MRTSVIVSIWWKAFNFISQDYPFPEIMNVGLKSPSLVNLGWVAYDMLALCWHYIITMMFQCRAIIFDHSCQWYIMKYTLLYNYIIIYKINHIYMFMLMIFKDHIVPYSSATFFLGGNMAMIPAGMPGERSGHGVGWRRLASPMHTLVMYDPFILCYVIYINICTLIYIYICVCVCVCAQ